MLRVHQLIEQLEDVIDVSEPKNPHDVEIVESKVLPMIRGAIPSAHKFDCTGIAFDMNFLDIANKMVACGELTAPFDVCVFEFKLDYKNPDTRQPGDLDVIALTRNTVERGSERFHLYADFFMKFPGQKRWRFNAGAMAATDHDLQYGEYYQSPDDIKDSVETYSFAFGSMLLCILAMMMTGCTKTETIAAPAKLNKTRIAKNRPPIFEHKTVVLNLNKIRTISPGYGQSHASPRLHWRRGHLRHLQSGTAVKVRPHLVGDASKGIIEHDYKITL